MERLRCVVERITYQTEQNGYSVIKSRAKGYSNLVTVVGAMPEIHVGTVLSLTGDWKMDSKYGRQFSIESFEEMIRSEDLRTEPLPDENGSAIYLPVFYFTEIGTARRLSEIYGIPMYSFVNNTADFTAVPTAPLPKDAVLNEEIVEEVLDKE